MDADAKEAARYAASFARHRPPLAALYTPPKGPGKLPRKWRPRS